MLVDFTTNGGIGSHNNVPPIHILSLSLLVTFS